MSEVKCEFYPKINVEKIFCTMKPCSACKHNENKSADKPTFRIDEKAKGRERRMLETFGEQLKEQGWREVKNHEADKQKNVAKDTQRL